MKTRSWFANGKLLLTGEYLVMHGAKALAVPLQLGQAMVVQPISEKMLKWNALKIDGLWFQTFLTLPDLKVVHSTNDELSSRLATILSATASLNSRIFNEETGFKVETHLFFNPEYGFGSSSTLISNLAEWAEVDPYTLLKQTFGGSGYDIACARCKGPIFYQLDNGHPSVQEAGFNPSFADKIFFVYLGRKQKSTEAISDFKRSAIFSQNDIHRVSQISEEIIKAKSLKDFEQLISEHETLMSSILKKPKVKSTFFSDLEGSAKSLGAWGGDFVLLTTKKNQSEMKDYLFGKGFSVFFSYNDLVLT